ncbi:hypothetical protein FIU96_05490 [Marinobacter sp. THAF39]|uniref:Uncharacterized protein n=1 Tax=Marinobacter nauticus TaxID=2743 RepID=A0A455W290_MARNT|nr:hypothetical protein FIV08_05565 [Marinobacter sp. THAF197a]QFT50084.1 hypothetical protein FIU96_05490 [Marinobacter sp. THAF39]BBJ03306.1 hypothetical protein YBY_11540 [Marinobacter nauticus]
MSERSELFFQKKSNSHTASPPAQPEVWEPNLNEPLSRTNSRLFLEGHINNRMQLLQLRA